MKRPDTTAASTIEEVARLCPGERGGHLPGDDVVDVQYRTDVHDHGWQCAPVCGQLDLVGLLRQGLVGYCQPGEGGELLRHGDGITSSAVRVNHCVDGRRELVAPFPSGEQIDVLARTIEDAVSLDGVAAGQGEAIPTGYPKPYFRQFEEAGIHANRPAPEVARPVPGSVTATAPASEQGARGSATSAVEDHRRAIDSTPLRLPPGSGRSGT